MAQEVNQDQQQFHEVAAGFANAMLVTLRPDGAMHARPMAVAALRPNGQTYFATTMDSPKVQELEANAEVLVTFQGESQFATLRGPVRVSQDAQLIDELWQSDWEVWFPAGKTDPNLCILVVTARDGEFWDRRGAQGVGYRFIDAEARRRGDTSDVPEENHAKVRFGTKT